MSDNVHSSALYCFTCMSHCAVKALRCECVGLRFRRK